MLLLFILVLFTLQFTWMPLPVGNFVGATPIATGNLGKPGCATKCGDVTVAYPFGIGEGCFLDKSFELTCSTRYDPPKPVIGSSTLELYSISDSQMTIFIVLGYKCYDSSGASADYFYVSSDIEEQHPFSFSETNKLTVIGCNDYAWISGPEGSDYKSGCMGLCYDPNDVPTGECPGPGCCQIPIRKGFKHINITLGRFSNHTSVKLPNRCSYAFVGDVDNFQFNGTTDLYDASEFYLEIEAKVHTVLDWEITGNPDCSQPAACKANSLCKNASISGYRCSCKEGYEGNPYLDPGCQDIDECQDNSKYHCYGLCENNQGSYNCSCKLGFTGNATSEDGCRPLAEDSKFLALEISLALVFGLLAIFTGITGIYFGVRKRNLIKLREKFFEQNGGVFLQQKLKAPGATDTVTMFSTQQLRKATENYSEERIVGRGGYGVVYRGILSDTRVVAIKKSKLVDRIQSEQFINEVFILTQVIHRNVVKLLGCCLEEEVPVLVYEFISNNTLYYHLHNESGGMSWLSWENRLRVAAEAASAVAYLHSQAAMPIIHRDVKSANILLDENYTTKISDFGASRMVPLDHDQVTTLVQGTLGYLDPEYFHTSQLTGKSDVYSFGVVLAELITGQKPLSAFRTNEDKNLATYFVKSMEENRLFLIIDPRVVREGNLDQLQAVAELIRRCVSLEGKYRPTMKDVAMELEGLRKFTTHPWLPQQTPAESRSLILEGEQSDLYGVPLIQYSYNEWESYSGITEITSNIPR